MAMGSFNSQASDADGRNQHDAAGRRDAGAADHLHHHRAADDALGAGRPAARRQHADAGKADDAAGRSTPRTRYLSVPRRSTAAFWKKFREAVAKDANVEMHLKADRSTRYETVAETMSAARRAGLTKIGFVTQPGSDASIPSFPRRRESMFRAVLDSRAARE
jgi:hypothetical protein